MEEQLHGHAVRFDRRRKRDKRKSYRFRMATVRATTAMNLRGGPSALGADPRDVSRGPKPLNLAP